MRVKRILLLSALCGLMTACQPPFDTGMGQAMRLIRNMTLETRVGPFSMSERTPNLADGAVFLPFRAGTDIVRTSGLIRIQDEYNCRIWHVWGVQDGAQTVYSGFGSDSLGTIPLTGNTPAYPEVMTHCVASGTIYLSFQFAPLNALGLLFQVNSTGGIPSIAAIGTYPQTTFLPGSFLGMYLNPLVLGGHFPSEGTGTADHAYFLVAGNPDGSAGYWEMESQLTPGALNVFSITTSGVPLPFLAGPPAAQRCMYFHDPAAKRSFASALVGGSWQCWTWNTDPVSAPVQLAGVTRRVDALLSTGELFSVQDGTGTVYGPDGTQRTSFPLGCLQFLGETDVSGAKAALFHLVIADNDAATFYIYSLPSARLAELN